MGYAACADSPTSVLLVHVQRGAIDKQSLVSRGCELDSVVTLRQSVQIVHEYELKFIQ